MMIIPEKYQKRVCFRARLNHMTTGADCPSGIRSRELASEWLGKKHHPFDMLVFQVLYNLLAHK